VPAQRVSVPAATDNQIHAGNAHNIKAKRVVGAASNPTTPQADDILKRKGIHVLPDILVNAGGVTVSYYEWVQNQANEQWDIDVIEAHGQDAYRDGYRVQSLAGLRGRG